MENPEWTLKLPPDQHFEAKVSFMYDNSLVKDLKERLNENQLNLFNQTCLSHFIHLHRLQNCGALVHSLLLREVVNEEIDDGSLRFLVGREVLEFSKRDFALILGLSMDQNVCLDDVVPKQDRLKTKYFGGVVKINLDELWDAIESCEDDADKVKLACVCLVEYFLLGKDRYSTAVDDRHLDLVDDLEAFNTYLWGREVHERTFKYLRKAVSLRSSKKIPKKVKRQKKSVEPTREKLEKYTLLGFPYILQVWAYEVIRQVGDNFAERTGVVTGPRILHWSCKRWHAYQQLNDSVDVSPITPTELELTQLRVLKVDGDVDDIDVYEGDVSDDDVDDDDIWEDDVSGEDDEEGVDITGQVNSVNAAALLESQQELQTLKTKYESLRCDYNNLIVLCVELTSGRRGSNSQCEVIYDLPNTGTPQCMDGKVVAESVGMTPNDGNQLESEGREITKDDCHGHLDVTVGSVGEENEVGEKVYTMEDVYDDLCIMLSSLDFKKGAKISTNIHRFVASLSVSQHRGIRATKKAMNVLSPYTTAYYTRKKKTTVFDPFKECPREDELKFICFCYEWIHGGVMVEVKMTVGDGDIKFFRDLFCPEIWLSNFHMDCWLHRLRLRKRLYPDTFGGSWTTTDCAFISGLILRYEKFAKSCPKYDWKVDGTHLNYLEGKVMREGCKWTEVDLVYCPYNVNDNHWIVVIIDLVDRKFKICDAMMGRWHPMKSTLSCLKQMVPNLLIKSQLFDDERKSHFLNGEWELERVEGLPRQDNGNDCGVYALKYIEFLCSGTEIGQWSRKEITLFRRKMAVELYSGNHYV